MAQFFLAKNNYNKASCFRHFGNTFVRYSKEFPLSITQAENTAMEDDIFRLAPRPLTPLFNRNIIEI